MKVAQEIDVDNITIIVNEQNQLESQVVVEEFADLVIPVKLRKDGAEYSITKVGKLVGTDWLVFQVGGALETVPTPPTTEPNPTPTKETIRIPTSVLVKDMSNDTHVWAGEHKHRIAYVLTPEDNEAFKTGTVSSNAVLTFNMLSSRWGSGYRTTKDVTLPTNAKGEFELHIDYVSSDSTSEIESVIPSGAITVETEDKIYMYELVSPVTVVNYGEMYPPPSFTAELNCGNYTWTEETDEQGEYLLGTATQPATITVVPTNFTVDDVYDIRLILDNGYMSLERNGLVVTLSSEEYADVGATTYPICDAIVVVFNNGKELRHDVRLECPITK